MYQNASMSKRQPCIELRALREEDVLDAGEDVMHQFCDEPYGAYEVHSDGSYTLVEWANDVHELSSALWRFFARPFFVH